MENQFYPKSKKEWRTWLEKNHEKESKIWLVYYKKHHEKYNLSWSDAVDEALCFGWIDSTKKTLDADRYIQLFTKRNAKSTWSKINKEKIKVLTQANKIRPAGQAIINIAKENGNWNLLDDVENLIIPQELKGAFAKDKTAFEFYQEQSNSTKKSILYWVITAKRKETKLKRVTEIIERAKEGKKPKFMS